MSLSGSVESIESVYKRLTVLEYSYSQIVEQEARDAWKSANSACLACYEGERNQLTEDTAKIRAAASAVDALEDVCRRCAIDRDTQKSQLEQIPSYLQEQALTKADDDFISNRRIDLSGTIPERGVFDTYFETGTEGTYWSIEVDGLEGYDSLRLIEQGDRLVVYDTDQTVLFDEIIIKDCVSGWEPYRPDRPYGYGQQACGGLWVHWIPKGWSSNSWALMVSKLYGKTALLYRLPETDNKTL